MGLRDLLSQLRRARPIGTQQRTPHVVASQPAAAARPAPRVRRQANWLEDALRLRPPRRTREVLLTTSAPTSQAQGKRRAEVVAGTTHKASDASERQVPPHQVPPHQAPSQNDTHRPDTLPTLDAPASHTAPATPLASSDVASSSSLEDHDALAELEGMDAVRRRLELVRYLVRRRVYNEGFSPDETPEQYRWSTPPHLPPTSN